MLRVVSSFVLVLLLSDALCFAGSPGYLSQASEVTRYIQHNFYDQGAGLYHHSITDKNAEFMWGNGVIFPALVGACRYEPNLYRPIMSRFFKAMDRYWDSKANPPGYEPSPTNGNGHDKYYDDNEWMVITFTEAYELTRDTRYLDRANAALKFSLSGWDDQLGGGIWWHEGHKGDSKNTCSNGPAAFACLRMEKYLPAAQAAADQAAAIKIIKWTTEHLQASDGLYGDNQNVTTEKKNGGKLTYNTALMIRAQLALYRWTGNHQYLLDAQRSAKAGDWFLDKKTKAFRDDIKFAHLMVEADLDLYRTTHEDYLLKRAADNAAFYYQAWKEKPSPELIENAALARILWLMADTESDTGKQFWAKADAVRN